jgi:ADP-ribose pyrophosphatase YjhB (NUDIX family)
MASGSINKKKNSQRPEQASANSRIASVAQEQQDEAARSLAREMPPRKIRPARPLHEPMLPSLAAALHESERAILLEVTDHADRPLLLMLPEDAMRQRQRLRLAAVGARTRQNRLVLHRRRDARLSNAGTWDLYTGFVMVGEAREDAAIRLLETGALIGGLRMVHVADREETHVHLALYMTNLPAGVYPAHPAQELLEVDADELRGLVQDAPELFSDELAWAEKKGLLFRRVGM